MKLVCVYDSFCDGNLTIGKIYELIEDERNILGMISVIDDYEIRRNYHYSRFIKLEEWRDNKLSMLEI